MPPISPLRQYAIPGIFALIGWAFCGAIIGIGRQLTTMQMTLIIHAIGAPIIFAVIARVYQRRYGVISPLRMACFFLFAVIGIDALIVAPFMERSFAMFASVLGTWFPFVSIFFASWISGGWLRRL